MLKNLDRYELDDITAPDVRIGWRHVESSKPALICDIESRARLGRVTLWVSGECDSEVLDAETGETCFWDHSTVASCSGFHELIRRVLGLVNSQ